MCSNNNTNASEDNQYYYSQGFDAEDEFGMGETENQEDNVVKPDSPVNYQTYMNKTPRTRWSKQDTQLFYEVINFDLTRYLNAAVFFYWRGCLFVHTRYKIFLVFFFVWIKLIQAFGGNLSMVQQMFPDRTRQQIKLKFKLEERRNPLKINDALSTRPKGGDRSSFLSILYICIEFLG